MQSINEELRSRIVDIEARSYKFGKYLQKLEKCDTQSNLTEMSNYRSFSQIQAVSSENMKII